MSRDELIKNVAEIIKGHGVCADSTAEKVLDCVLPKEMEHLYFYAGIVPGEEGNGYVSGTLKLDNKISSDEQYRNVLSALEGQYGGKYSMLNFNYMGIADE